MKRVSVAALTITVAMLQGHASAQSFQFEDQSIPALGLNSFTRVFVSDGENTEQISRIRPNEQNISVSGFGSTTSNTVTDTLIRFESVWDGTPTTLGDVGFAGGSTQQFFTVSEPGTLRVSWDLTNTDFGINNVFPDDGLGSLFAVAEEADLPVVEFLSDPGNGAGTLEVDVVPGVNYGVQLTMANVIQSEPGVTSFLQAELIPTPSGAALLGLGGLTLTRRRRA